VVVTFPCSPPNRAAAKPEPRATCETPETAATRAQERAAVRPNCTMGSYIVAGMAARTSAQVALSATFFERNVPPVAV
jgi:hypothetical protein